MSTETDTQRTDPGSADGRRDTLTVTDNRTGRTYEIDVTDDTVRATDLRQIKVEDDDFGLMAYDPAFMNTASCRSAITYLDGENAESLGLSGREEFAVAAVDNGEAREVTVRADDKEFRARLRLDTPREREYLRHGGILRYVLRRLLTT